MHHESLHYATLSWRENGEPFSPMFDDVYFVPDNALQESHYVFLQGNHLPERWQGKKQYVIAELGFGTGVNFLLTWKEWQSSALTDAQLHYISFEKFPLHPDDFQRIHEKWPELLPYAKELQASYPPALAGFHRILLDNGRVILTLVWGDVQTCLSQLEAKVDSWYLDGFAPGKNPEMWSDSLYQYMAERTARDGTLATFSAAGHVRRGLENAGFKIEKIPGFGRKREMLQGVLPDAIIPPKDGKIDEQPWFYLPKNTYHLQHAIVIGGGMAGASAAYHLAKRCWHVTLIERHTSLAQEASGNPAGIMMPLVASPKDVVGQFYLAAYRYLLQHIPQLAKESGNLLQWDACGVLQLNHSDSVQKRYKEALGHPAMAAGLIHSVTANEASAIAGVDLAQDGLFFPHGGWVSPPSLCETYRSLAGERVTTCFHSEAVTLEYQHPNWQVKGIDGEVIAEAPVVIIANATDATKFPQCQWLSLRKIRGQITYMEESDVSQNLKTVLYDEGYMIPAIQGRHCIGATFLPDDESSELRQSEHRENLESLKRYVPEGFLSEENLSGRVAFRAGSPDRRPMVGMIPDYQAFKADYHDLHHGKYWVSYPQGKYMSGLYISVGHGSRGLVSTPLAGELLASLITGAPLPLEKNLVDALNPARVVIRRMIKS